MTGVQTCALPIYLMIDSLRPLTLHWNRGNEKGERILSPHVAPQKIQLKMPQNASGQIHLSVTDNLGKVQNFSFEEKI